MVYLQITTRYANNYTIIVFYRSQFEILWTCKFIIVDVICHQYFSLEYLGEGGGS